MKTFDIHITEECLRRMAKDGPETIKLTDEVSVRMNFAASLRDDSKPLGWHGPGCYLEEQK